MENLNILLWNFGVRPRPPGIRESGIPKIPGGNSQEFFNSRREFPGISTI